MCIVGDFNFPDVDVATFSIQISRYSTTLNEDIISVIEDLRLNLTVDFKTRGDNVLDLVFTSQPSAVIHTESNPALRKADHVILSCDSQVKPVRSRKLGRYMNIWKKSNTEGIRTALHSLQD